MRIFDIAPAALAALSGATRRSAAVAVPCFMVQTREGFAADAATFTGAFRAIRRLPAEKRETARVYDENGYCMYR